jgi:hypothetical protein
MNELVSVFFLEGIASSKIFFWDPNFSWSWAEGEFMLILAGHGVKVRFRQQTLLFRVNFFLRQKRWRPTRVRLYFIDDKHDIFCSSVMHIKKIARC